MTGRCRPEDAARQRQLWSRQFFVRLAKRHCYGCALRSSFRLPPAATLLELDLRQLLRRLAELAQERQPARVGVDLVEQVLRHDLGEAGVAVLDRLVEPLEGFVRFLIASALTPSFVYLSRAAQLIRSNGHRDGLQHCYAAV